jgi:hypothetical protein
VHEVRRAVGRARVRDHAGRELLAAVVGVEPAPDPLTTVSGNDPGSRAGCPTATMVRWCGTNITQPNSAFNQYLNADSSG